MNDKNHRFKLATKATIFPPPHPPPPFCSAIVRRRRIASRKNLFGSPLPSSLHQISLAPKPPNNEMFERGGAEYGSSSSSQFGKEKCASASSSASFQLYPGMEYYRRRRRRRRRRREGERPLRPSVHIQSVSQDSTAKGGLLSKSLSHSADIHTH